MLSFSRKLSYLRRSQRRLLFLTLLAAFFGVMGAKPALASDITVASPISGSTTTSPMWVRAHNVGCYGLGPIAFGFSVDSSSSITWGVTPWDIDLTGRVIASGYHTIHFKSWTRSGICPVVNSAINVLGSTSTTTTATSTTTATTSSTTTTTTSTSTSIPSTAIASSDLDTETNWLYEHDGGTPGTSQGSTVFPATTPLYDDAREFYMTYSSRGGERWHITFAKDAVATHFALDTYVYVENPDQLANLELDLNQVIPNGDTVIFGTQCSTYSGTWEWTYHSSTGSHWNKSNIPCNPRTWAANSWHHIQIGFHRDDSGYVTHDWVEFDGTHSVFSNASGPAGEALGWAAGSLVMNVQLDGYNTTSGSVTAYLHKTTFYRW